MAQGVERECLRIHANAKASVKFHPKELGHKLKNSYITTDYSENLLEFITSPHNSVEDLYDELLRIHQFVLEKNPDELIWPSSMPSILPENDDDIAVADYGNSNVGLLKKVYRVGLGNRYGKKMQSIAGIHFNFSLNDDFWKKYQEFNKIDDLQKSKDIGYFSMIRNYKRYQWVLSYLFGASPCVDESFLKGRDHDLKELTEGTFFKENATSLRMGGLGYTSKLQDKIEVCYNTLETYVEVLEKVRTENVALYENIGLKKDDEYLQLNTNLLQIDNEFYSTIRPKRTANSRESALQALHRGGVDYIEVRILDVNPFDKLGFSVDQMKFLQVFLMTCIFEESPEFDNESYQDSIDDLNEVVTNGQKLSLELNKKINYFFERMRSILDLFPEEYSNIIDQEYKKIEDKSLLLSSRVLHSAKESNSFIESMLDLSKFHRSETLRTNSNSNLDLEAIALKSFEEEKEVLENDSRSFDEFLKYYFESITIKEIK